MRNRAGEKAGFISSITKSKQWFTETPKRALDGAYQAAMTIKSIEAEQVNIAGEATSLYTPNVGNYFRSDIEKQIQILNGWPNLKLAAIC
ncbi:MAG: hypothetical protein Fur0025_36680 [Oscillatoriaceae cyanobacterium]